MAALACLVALALTSPAAAQDQPTEKVAFLVGVSKYQKDGLADLHYPENDMRALGDELRKAGFRVTLLLGHEATRDAIASKLDAFLAELKKFKKEDVALVAFSGHGLQFLVPRDGKQEEDAFFCPSDGLKTDPSTLLSISRVMDQLDAHSSSSQNLLVIDACRDNLGKGEKGIDGSTVRQLPGKISILFSSSAGQQSYESDKVKGGVFTHVLLEGLRGYARNARDQVTWLSLADYVINEVPRMVPEVLDDPQKAQQPNLVGRVSRQSVLQGHSGEKP